MDTIKTSRIIGIGYVLVCTATWQFIDLTTHTRLPGHYSTRTELLADIGRFATL